MTRSFPVKAVRLVSSYSARIYCPVRGHVYSRTRAKSLTIYTEHPGNIADTGFPRESSTPSPIVTEVKVFSLHSACIHWLGHGHRYNTTRVEGLTIYTEHPDGIERCQF